ncbi:MAG: HAD family phosphatase [Erysipelothrix sp.]|nr:HAD family phosphatase [Erysipelothrix sp.]
MSKIKLVMVDLDGTILLDHKNFTDNTKKAIEKLLDAGIEVVPTTGRYYNGIPDYFTNHQKIKYIVSSNGALISNNTSKRGISEQNIDQLKAIEILKQAHKEADHAFIVTNKGVIMNKERYFDEGEIDDEFMKKFYEDRFIVDDILKHVKENKLTIKKIEFHFEDLDQRNKFHELFSSFENINTVSSNELNIEITSKSASKGEALHFLKDYLGLSQKETMAIGDSENDISMLKEAGISVVMGNATDSVKAFGDKITKSYLEDGFSAIISEIFKFEL